MRVFALFSYKLYARQSGATLCPQVTIATIWRFRRHINAVILGLVAFAFQQFFAVFADSARNKIAFGPPSGNIIRRHRRLLWPPPKRPQIPSTGMWVAGCACVG